MIFKPEHISMIVAGRKTQTRRVCKPGESYAFRYLGSQIEHFTDGSAAYNPVAPNSRIVAVYTASGRVKWRVGNTYAVQPGRGKPGVWWNRLLNGVKEWQETRPGEFNNWKPLRIRILELRREPVQAISEADAIAEGCTRTLYDASIGRPSYRAAYQSVWREINTRKGTRWADNPMCWAITFECEGVK